MTRLTDLLATTSTNTPIEVSANWLQGRTAYGGLSAALALQTAMNQANMEGNSELSALKAAHISFIAPMAGALSFKTELLRQGKSVTSLSVDGFAGGQLGLRAAFIFAQSRTSNITHQLAPMPAVQPPTSYAAVSPKPGAPAFLSNFDVCYLNGVTPVCGATMPEFLAWVRFSYPVADVHPAVALLAMGDCLAPAAMACFTEFAPANSMNWTVHFPLPAQPGEWFLLQSKGVSSAQGYSYQTMQAWNEQGEPVLLGSQTVAVFA